MSQRIKITEIDTILKDLIEAHEKGIERHGLWFGRLMPFFNKKFGPNWREKDRDFWDNFDSKRLITKEEVEEII